MTVADIAMVPTVARHSIKGMTLFLVEWYDAEPKWDASQFIMARSPKAARDVIWEMEDVGNPKRIKATPITSEAQFRLRCKPEHDGHAMIEDVRDYEKWHSPHEYANPDTLYCCHVEDLLPLLREEWWRLANEAEERRLQLALPLRVKGNQL